MPKISVIVPVYNTEKYLKKCLESILNQTYQDFEIIIVNDGSTDGSEEIILDFKDKYNDKVKYFKQENEGIAKTRNFAVQNVSGEHFIFVDSDDYIEKDLLQTLTDTVLKQEIDIVKYKMNIIDSNTITKIEGPSFDVKKGEVAFCKLCFEDKMIDTPCLYMFNTQFYKENKFEFSPGTYHEDFGLIPLILISAKKVISIEKFGYNYVQEENSITRNSDYKKTLKKSNDLFIHYDNMINFINNMELNETTKENIKQYYSNAILKAYKNLNKNDKKIYMDEIKTRNILNNMKTKSLKSCIKKIFFVVGINIY